MIVGNNFIWLHLPKTGGTSIALAFRNLALEGVVIDDETKDSKHDSCYQRAATTGLRLSEGIPKYITCRRLIAWLLSDWHHKTISMGLNLDFEPVKSGLFYSLRLGGIWVAADYWISYFEAAKCTGFIRLEELEKDANQIIHPHLPLGTPRLLFPQINSNNYSNRLGDFFSDRDLSRIYTNNPLWSAWEEQVYGSRTTLPLPERLRSLRRRLR